MFSFISFWALFLPLALAAQSAPIKGSDLFTGAPREVNGGSKGTVVVFLSAKCPCSSSHVEEIKTMAKDFPDFQFVGIHSNPNEGKELTRGYFKDTGISFPLIHDSDGSLAARFRASKTPHAFLLAPDGGPLYRGGVTDSKDCNKMGRNFLREALADANENKKIRTPEARTLGCAIPRGDKSDW